MNRPIAEMSVCCNVCGNYSCINDCIILSAIITLVFFFYYRMSVTPNLQAVYSKWEKRGPSSSSKQTDSNTQKILQDGRQKWRDKYGDNIKPRRSKQRAVPIENVCYDFFPPR